MFYVIFITIHPFYFWRPDQSFKYGVDMVRGATGSDVHVNRKAQADLNDMAVQLDQAFQSDVHVDSSGAELPT